ncbi:Glycosyl transferase, family 2 [Rhodospirillaceae bacterium LM-1]|nr:Glycosyl transferase, family 2 [Rhodospirillaceae bacterium LM-1]
MTNNHCGLSVVIPAYNEESSIAKTLERVLAVTNTLGLPCEVLLVNDGSKDNTKSVAEAFKDIRIISHPVNTGYGSAIKTGILCAKYEWIGIVDADLTYEIEKLPLLIEKMNDGFDMVVAARSNVFSHDMPFKRLMRRVLVALVKLIIAAKIEDPNSGFRIFNRSMAMAFFPFLCNTFSFTTSITLFALGDGYFVSYVPMTYAKRDGKSKVRHFRDSLRMAQLIMQGIAFFNPLKMYLILIGLLVMLIGLPSLLMLAYGHSTLSLLFLLIGISIWLLAGLGIHGDIVRISASGRLERESNLVANYLKSRDGDDK